MSKPPVEVQHLKKYFHLRRGLLPGTAAHVQAVDDVSFHIDQGETLGLVGESGCGKTTTGRTLLRLIEPTAGKLTFGGQDITAAPARQLRNLRQNMQIVFQDPFGSLNPRMTAGAIVEEGLIVHRRGSKRDRLERVRETLGQVGLDPNTINRYPHEFSGGQRQRISIARALALQPQFIVLDEPVSALDVSIQAQIINLLTGLRERLALTYLFISHDLSVVEYISDRVAVMYLGRIVEIAPSAELYRNPLHPYTQVLLSSVPRMEPGRKPNRTPLQGDVPSPTNPPSGCRFHTRCPLAIDVCRHLEPRALNLDGHQVWCHVVEEQLTGKTVAA